MKAALLCTFPLLLAIATAAQTLPGTAGETLSGKRIVVAQATPGHPTILVAAFSHDAGQRCEHWMHAIQRDPALAGVPAYQLVELEKVPELLRGALRNLMRKNVDPAEHDRFIVLTQDEKLWRTYFNVTADQDPYVILLDSNGKVQWSGHGSARELEPKLRASAH